MSRRNQEGIASAKRGWWVRFQTIKGIMRQIMREVRKVIESATTWISRKHTILCKQGQLSRWVFFRGGGALLFSEKPSEIIIVYKKSIYGRCLKENG